MKLQNKTVRTHIIIYLKNYEIIYHWWFNTKKLFL